MNNEKLSEAECKKNIINLKDKNHELNKDLKKLHKEIEDNQLRIRSMELFLDAFKITKNI
ncbi:hypothetical protein OAJ43_00230 [Nitrosomonadales bacterium]|nr:hypothetical protein [Nitrosomonadales bacterium]|tara:strand:- start:421 stop:600 length:180 start_codon:yes stop_codon:yes gene_type:complete